MQALKSIQRIYVICGLLAPMAKEKCSLGPNSLHKDKRFVDGGIKALQKNLRGLYG
jgi:hypothetical protein